VPSGRSKTAVSILITSLFEDLDVEGMWWLPTSKERHIAGSLHFLDGRLTLDLQGSLFGELSERAGPSETIQGVATDGTPITLGGCQLTNSTLSLGATLSPGRSSFIARIAVIGDHISDMSKTTFSALTVSYQHLTDWIACEPFDLQFDAMEEAEGAPLKLRPPTDIEAHVETPGVNFRLYTQVVLNHKQRKQAKLDYRAYIDIEPDKPMPLDDLLLLQKGCRDFLTLMVGESTPLALSRLRQTKGGENLQVLVQHDAREAKKEIHPVEMLAPLPVVRDRLAQALDTWYALVDELGPVIHLYFSVLGRGSSLSQFDFLALVQALESYHRRRIGGRYLPDDEYETLRSQIVAGFPEKMPSALRQKLKSMLKFANEPSLRKRLKELLGQLSDEMRQALADDQGHFIERVVDTRNYLTHLDEYSRGNVLETGQDFYDYIILLEAFLAMLFFQALDIPEADIRDPFIRRFGLYPCNPDGT
jgi:hypothetical protein